MRVVAAALSLCLILPAPVYPDTVPAPTHYAHNWHVRQWQEPSRGDTGIEMVAALAEQTFPHVDVDGLPLPVVMTAIGYAESMANPAKIGDRDTPYPSVGIWQIRLVHVAYLERVTRSENRTVWIAWLENPQNNAAAALAVYEGQGLVAWASYTSGRWRLYLLNAEKAIRGGK